MEGNISGEEGNIDWDTEDELEIENFGPAHPAGEEVVGSAEASSSASSSESKMVDHFIGMGFPEEMVVKAVQEHEEGDTDLILETLLKYSSSSSAGSSNSKTIDHFLGMGFPEEMVIKAIQENGNDNTDSILETLLTFTAIEKSPQAQPKVEPDQLSSEYEGCILEDYSDIDSWSDDEEVNGTGSDEDDKLIFLVRMGYTVEEAQTALERCGPDSAIGELTDFICAAQMSRSADALLGDPLEIKPKRFDYGKNKKQRTSYYEKKRPRSLLNGDCDTIRLPNPMVGFGTPTDPGNLRNRNLPEAAIGPPYFFYENVALAPKGVWDTMSRFLYEIEPEFVDSKYFCAAARKRGYIHNLPIENRFPLFPLPPHTVHEALPLTKRWWPSWDPRTKLNCLQTCIASAKLTERIRKALEQYDSDPPPSVQKFVLDECRKWNLVWVGRNKVAPLEPDEIEMLLGFPRNHTRGGGINRTDRYKSLGNSFQVDTVAYHLSVLKDLFPRGLNLLSLFSGIGGAEVALHRLGIPLNNVVSVEISEVNRGIVRSWWEQTNQKGTLVDIADVQHLDANRLEYFMESFGGFDLVVGGSPCNNLAGSNRVSRDGLEGEQSSLFYEYIRILDLVKCMTKSKQQ